MELCSSIGRAVCDIVEALRGIRLTWNCAAVLAGQYVI